MQNLSQTHIHGKRRTRRFYDVRESDKSVQYAVRRCAGEHSSARASSARLANQFRLITGETGRRR